MPHEREQLDHVISAALQAGGGRITMARFMELALNDPISGYYSRAARLLGARGDFTTAPHRVPAFSRAVGTIVAQILDLLLAQAGPGAVSVVEVGPGEGDLAEGVLAHWDAQRPDLRGHVTYALVEIGRNLRERQRTRLREAALRGWDVVWAASLGDCAPTRGVLVTNELVDALPVHLLDVRGAAPRECWVRRDTATLGGGSARGGLVTSWEDASPEALEELSLVFGTTEAAPLLPLTRNGLLEVRPAARTVLAQAARVLSEGAILTIDYGDWLPGPSREGSQAEGPSDTDCPQPGLDTQAVFGPALHDRTLRTYLRHERGDDPLLLPGRRDITADVDFRALHVHGRELRLTTALYCPLADLLAAAGAAEDLAELERAARSSLDADIEASTLAALLDRNGLGGLFKAMLQMIGD